MSNALDFTVIVDTNVLFTRNPTQIANKTFTENWKECCSLGKMNLVVPEVVMGERLYQIVIIGEKIRQDSLKSVETLAKLAGQLAPRLPTAEELRTGTEKLFDRWALENKVTVTPTPYDKIDWRGIVNDSIWRIKPFIAPGEKEDSEKGFRDKLILETVREFLATPRKGSAVFISGDKLLRQTAKSGIDTELFDTYEDIGGFLSHLKLTHANLGQQFVEAILKGSSLVFYTADNPECIYNKFNVYQMVIEKWGRIIDTIAPAASTGFGWPNYLGIPQIQPLSNQVYVPASKERIMIDETTFHSLAEDKKFEWRTRLRFLRVFRDIKQTALNGIESLNEIVRVAKFEVLWKADIDRDGKFSDSEIANITLLTQANEPKLYASGYGTFERTPPELPVPSA